MSTADRKRREQTVITVLLPLVILLAGLNAGRFFVRIDLSAHRMYSLSGTSIDMARSLPQPVSIIYFKSESLASRYAFPQAIQDILEEYAIFSDGRITLSVIDPASSKAPVQPETLGVVPQQMRVTERQGVNIANVYSGIVLRYLDGYETMPFATDPGSLEYDVSSRIRTLVSNTRTSIGIILGDDGRSLDQDYVYLMRVLQSQFSVVPVQKGTDIPPEVSALLVIGGKDLGAYDLFPIDQYVMGGGKAMFAVDSIDVDISQGFRASRTMNTALIDMLSTYGAKVLSGLVLDSVDQKLPYSTSQGRIMFEDYPHWIRVTPESVSKDSPITARFAGLDLYWPSPLESIVRSGVAAENLVSTSPDAWTMKDDFQTDPAYSNTPLVQDTGPRGRYTLALALSGTFSSYFTGKPAPAKPGEPPRTGAVREEGLDTRLIVVGDADFLTNLIQFTQQDNMYNLAFISNCIAWLVLDEDLLSIKTKAQVDVRLDRIEDPVRKSRVMLASQIINVAVIPFLVIAIGLLRLVLRRRKAA